MAQSTVAAHPINNEFVNASLTTTSPIIAKIAPSTVGAAKEADQSQSTAAAYRIDSGFVKPENVVVAVPNADVKREPYMAKEEAAALTTPKAYVEAANKSDGKEPAVKREPSAQGLYSSMCTDGHDACEEWAQVGECVKNPSYMHVKCRASCNMCR
jgi:hypothetical protein